MLTLYGTSHSRASRSLVALEELGLKYVHVPIKPPRETRTPEYLQKNPNGRIPCLEDDGLIIWESMAINLYLADKYGQAPMWPQSPEKRAHAYQWSFWVTAEIEPIMMEKDWADRHQDGAARASAMAQIGTLLRLLDHRLRESDYLLGAEFTIADVNLATAISEPHEQGRFAGWDDFDLSLFPSVKSWLGRCAARESYKKVRALP